MKKLFTHIIPYLIPIVIRLAKRLINNKASTKYEGKVTKRSKDLARQCLLYLDKYDYPESVELKDKLVDLVSFNGQYVNKNDQLEETLTVLLGKLRAKESDVFKKRS